MNEQNEYQGDTSNATRIPMDAVVRAAARSPIGRMYMEDIAAAEAAKATLQSGEEGATSLEDLLDEIRLLSKERDEHPDPEDV
jgi:hypothetical protein